MRELELVEAALAARRTARRDCEWGSGPIFRTLLPVPVLDGGQIVLTLAEAAKGSPFSVRARNAITIAGLVTVGLLFALVMFNDTIRRMV